MATFKWSKGRASASGGPGLWILASLLILSPAVQADAKGKPRGSKGDSPGLEQPADGLASVRPYLQRNVLLVESPVLTGYLDEIAARLLATVPDAPPAPRMLVESSDSFKVFTDAQGNIVVSTAVLREVASEDELAAAISHELAHVRSRDVDSRRNLATIPLGLETNTLLAEAMGEYKRLKEGRPRAGATAWEKDSLRMAQNVGMVWTDLLSPAWTRNQEREADRAGLDMHRDAGYDPAAFTTLFSRLDAARITRSQKLESIRQAGLEKLNAVKPAANRNQQGNQKGVDGDALVDSLKAAAGTSLVNTAFELFGSLNSDYDTPQERADLLLAYLAEKPPRRRDKTPRSPRFEATLRQGEGGRLLEADAAALGLMAALEAGDLNRARSLAAVFEPPPGQPLLSSHLNLALGAWYEASRRQDLAQSRADEWVRSEMAPGIAYVWSAGVQNRARRTDAALATLELGAARLGDRPAFLPELVRTARTGGQRETAENYALECSRTTQKDLGRALNLLAKLASGDKAAQQNVEATPLYQACTQALGYDVVKRREQEQARLQAQQERERQQQLKDNDPFGFNKKLSEKMKNLNPPKK
jgi:hypothetical protein